MTPEHTGVSDVPEDGVQYPAAEMDVSLGLHWTIKGSFVRYVLSGAGGTYSVAGGAEDDERGNFYFPLKAASFDVGSGWELRFTGDVRFSGHHGVLFVALVDPVVTLGATGGSLTVAAPGGVDRVKIADVTPSEPQQRGGLIAWPPLTTALTAEGVSMFGDVYTVGTDTDPLRIVIGQGTLS